MFTIKAVALTERVWKVLVILLAGAASTACTSPSQLYRVNVNDDSSSFYVANATIRPDGWQNKNPERGGAGIEFGYEHQSGEATQRLPGGFIKLAATGGSNVTINGPQYLRNSASADHGHVAFNYLLNFGRYFSLEPEVGIGYDQLNLTVRSLTSGVVVDTSRSVLGVTVGISPRWNFSNHFAVEGRIRYGQGRGNTSLYNPAFTYSPIKNISFALGYAWRDQWFSGKGNHSSATTAPGDTSDIELKYAGPSIGLRMKF